MCTCKKNSVVDDGTFSLRITDAGGYEKFVSLDNLEFSQSPDVLASSFDLQTKTVTVSGVDVTKHLELRLVGTTQEIDAYNAPIRAVEAYNVDSISTLVNNDLAVTDLSDIKANGGVISLNDFDNTVSYTVLEFTNVDEWLDTLAFDALYYRFNIYSDSGSMGSTEGRVGRVAFDRVTSGTKNSCLYIKSAYLANASIRLELQVSDSDFSSGPVPVNMASSMITSTADGVCSLTF